MSSRKGVTSRDSPVLVLRRSPSHFSHFPTPGEEGDETEYQLLSLSTSKKETGGEGQMWRETFVLRLQFPFLGYLRTTRTDTWSRRRTSRYRSTFADCVTVDPTVSENQSVQETGGGWVWGPVTLPWRKRETFCRIGPNPLTRIYPFVTEYSKSKNADLSELFSTNNDHYEKKRRKL